MQAVQQGVAAVERGATSFGSSVLGILQVKLSSSSHLYYCRNLHYICGSCHSIIPQISNCVSYSGHLVVLSRKFSGTFNYSSIDEHDTCIRFAQEKGAVFLYFCRCSSISSIKHDQELQEERRNLHILIFDNIILDVLQVKNELAQADVRRSSGWQDWGSGLGGLRGGTAEGGDIEDKSKAKVEARENVQSSRKVANAFLGGQPSWQGQESSCQGMELDLNLDEELPLYYGSEGNDLDEMIDGELNCDESYDSDETNSMDQGEVVESRDQTEHSEEVQGGATSVEEEVSTGMHFLRELDRDYMYSSRLVVRGEYEGSVNGKVYIG